MISLHLHPSMPTEARAHGGWGHRHDQYCQLPGPQVRRAQCYARYATVHWMLHQMLHRVLHQVLRVCASDASSMGRSACIKQHPLQHFSLSVQSVDCHVTAHHLFLTPAASVCVCARAGFIGKVLCPQLVFVPPHFDKWVQCFVTMGHSGCTSQGLMAMGQDS